MPEQYILEPADTRRMVNALLASVVESHDHQHVLEAELAHPAMIDRLRHMAGMSASDTTGTIALKINDQRWSISASVRSGRCVALRADPDAR